MFALSDFCMTVYLGAVMWKIKGSPRVTLYDWPAPFYGLKAVRPGGIIMITDCV